MLHLRNSLKQTSTKVSKIALNSTNNKTVVSSAQNQHSMVTTMWFFHAVVSLTETALVATSMPNLRKEISKSGVSTQHCPQVASDVSNRFRMMTYFSVWIRHNLIGWIHCLSVALLTLLTAESGIVLLLRAVTFHLSMMEVIPSLTARSVKNLTALRARSLTIKECLVLPILKNKPE